MVHTSDLDVGNGELYSFVDVIASYSLPASSCRTLIDVTQATIFTARRYASAVLAVVVCPSVCPSVCLSVCHKPVLYRNGNT